MGDDPARLTHGEGLLELVQTALRVSVRNADKLLDLDSEDPKTNLLFRVTQEIAEAALEAPNTRMLLSREVFGQTSSGACCRWSLPTWGPC